MGSSEDYSATMGSVGDYICAICDDGGTLIRCDGICGRLFHPSKYTGTNSKCKTLEMSVEQTRESKFLCNNCLYKQHQCFICGELGSSNMSSDLTEVFQCSHENCKHFYHVTCLSKYDENINLPNFECPVHQCFSCKNKKEIVATTSTEDMCLIECRRCPLAYHIKCLPREIFVTASAGDASRVWHIEGRQFFYCMKHEMVKDLRSAKRDHLVIPRFDLNLPPPPEL